MHAQVWDLQRLRRAASHTHSHFGHETPLVAVALIGDAVCTAGRDLAIRVVRAPAKREAAQKKRAVPLSTKNRRGSLFGSTGAEPTGEEVAREVEAEAQAFEDATQAFLRRVDEANDEMAGAPR